MSSEVDSPSGPMVIPKLEHAFTHWFAITEETGFQSSQSHANAGLSRFVRD